MVISNFYIAKFQITQAQWKIIAELPKIERKLELDPSHFKRGEFPVENISWYDAVEFCRRLSKATRKKYRLPSEAEWEYACRASTTTSFYFGETITTELANYRGIDYVADNSRVFLGNYANEPKGEYRSTTTCMGNFPPNKFGLYDMHGNVLEWCGDSWHESYVNAPDDGSCWLANYNNSNMNIVRGGSFCSNPGGCRSNERHKYNPKSYQKYIGFRCVAQKTI